MPDAIPCCECHVGKGITQCQGSQHSHLLCHDCISGAKKRARKDSFYWRYVYYCDTCIWFDMG